MKTKLKLEPGKFYHHEHGRSIAVLGEVETFKWGPLIIIEETDRTGHSISVTANDAEDLHDRWVEISKKEFMKHFHTGGKKKRVLLS